MNGAPAIRQVVDLLDRLGIEWYVGGSLASAQFGEPRSTADTDFGAVIPESCIAPLVQAAGAEFYVSEPAVRDAVARGKSFNLIHLPTTWKIDVFVVRPGTLGEVALRRRRRVEVDLGDVTLSLWMATAEDVILMKLDWYRRGGGVSDRQWNDILGVVRVQGDQLDRAWIEETAPRFRLQDLWRRALADADGA